MNLPYITGELPGIGGQLRAIPDHFVVDELPLYTPSGEGQHLYVNLTKSGLTTKEVQRLLARTFGKSERDVGFAGMKDKHACTTQTFSITVQHAAASDLQSVAERIDKETGITVNWVDRHTNKLKIGHLLGNRFRITITDLNCEGTEALNRAHAIVDELKRRGLPNYFGPQRFGQNGRNVEQGLAVIQRKLYVKDRWLRNFLISSYQSHLCNLYLARRVEAELFDSILDGDVAKKYDTGGIFDVENVDVEQARYLAQEISFTAPLFGPKMRTAQRVAGALEDKVLTTGTVGVEDLARAGANGTRRIGRLLTPDLAVSVQDGVTGNNLIAEFSLAKGAFATTVLRELMKVALDNGPDLEMS